MATFTVQTAEAERLEEPWTANIDRELKVRLDNSLRVRA
jgi:hypothetical protein